MEQEELFIPKTKHKALKIILAILLIAGLMVGGYFLYQYKFNNPKTIVKSVITEAKNNIKESFKVDEHSKYQVSGLIKVDTNINDETLKILKDIELQYDGEIDTKENNGNLEIKSKYQDDKLINFKTYYEKDLAYLLLEDIYDKYLKINTKESNQEIPETVTKINLNKDEIQTIMEGIVDSLEKEVNELDIEKTDTSITIDNEKIDVINNFIELKDNEVNKFIQGMVKNLKNNQEFMTVMDKLTNNKAKETLDSLEDGLNEEAFKGIYRINFYTDKGIFNKKIVSVRQTIVIDEVTLNFNVDKISDDEILITLSTKDYSYSLRVKKNSSVINLKLDVTANGEYINIEFNINYEKINSITKPDLTNSKDINELTEEENKEIEDKLLENEVLVKLLKKINSIGKKEV